MFSLIARNREWRDLGPSLFLHVFHKTVVPILDYGGEIWGIYDWEDIERTHLFACKHILNVNMYTATDAIYAETGCTPLVAKRHVAAIKFAIRLSTLSSDTLSRKACNMLVFEDAKGHYNWISLMTELFRRYKTEVNDLILSLRKRLNLNLKSH